MHTGFYTVASGMLTRQHELDTIGNNLSNMQTPGYRADRVVTSAFEMSLMKRYDKDGATVLGDGTGYPITVVSDEVSDFSNGTINPTGRVLDMALSGEGFFNIQGQDGTTYLTRAGQFFVDDQGYLALPGMGRVLGQAGPIQVKSENIVVREDGEIFGPDGAALGRLRITAPVDNTTLVKMGNGAYTAPQGAADAQNVLVYQGSIEMSNVNMNQEMTNLIAVQRAFQACSSALQIIDGIDRKAATQIASIQ